VSGAGASPPEPLGQLAERCGVEPLWRDNWLVDHPTAPETAAGLLAAMGIDASDPAAAAQRLDEAEWEEFAPPVIVVRASAPPATFLLHLPCARRPPREALRVTVELAEESGDRRRSTFADGDFRLLGTRSFGGRVCRRFAVPLPGPLPLGYHTLRVTAREGEDTVARELPLIACPDRAWSPPELEGGRRAAGLSVALYGLRSDRDGGVGDFGDLRRLTSWAAEALGVSFIGLNPLHAVRNRPPYGHSPYLPLSALFANYLYLEPAAVPEFADCPEAQALAAAAEPFAAALRAAPHVNYDESSRLKLRVLRALFARFLAASWRHPGRSARRRLFEDFLAREGPELERFALFAALDEHFGAAGVWSWRQWPTEYHRPDTPQVRAFRDASREAVLFWQWVQWQCEQQLAALDEHARACGLALGYYHDLALAVDEHGADYWAQQDLFATGARVGAPPDDFNREGQDWGFPPPHPERDRAAGYRAFVSQLRRSCRHAGMLRFDHVMRLARLFWIPAGLPASAGAYVRYRRDELFGIVALESVRNRTVIVGEDLGVVPEGFREEMARTGICSCRLLYFERGADGGFNPPEAYPADAVVSITTHDLPTLAGFWSGADLETRRRIGLLAGGEPWERAVASRREDRRLLLELLVRRGLLPPERLAEPDLEGAEIDGALHQAVVGLLCGAPSRFFLLAQEDLFKVREQQNVPGTVTERPNWVWRMPFTVEELATDPLARDCAAMYRGWIERSGRRL
jgi:4-alpha-glucanotransferase